MIKNADIKERLDLLIGQELNSENLHVAIFCEEKHKKMRRRFDVGTHTYIQYQIKSKNSLTCNHLPIFLFQVIPTPLELVWKKRMDKSSSIPNQESLIHICHENIASF